MLWKHGFQAVRNGHEHIVAWLITTYWDKFSPFVELILVREHISTRDGRRVYSLTVAPWRVALITCLSLNLPAIMRTLMRFVSVDLKALPSFGDALLWQILQCQDYNSHMPMSAASRLCRRVVNKFHVGIVRTLAMDDSTYASVWEHSVIHER